MSALLEIKGLRAGYGPVEALRGVSLSVGRGEIACLIGANGAGKTTLLNVISGLHHAGQGKVLLEDSPVTNLKASKCVKKGVVQVPEGRQVFAPLSVEDNLRLGGYVRMRKEKDLVEEDLKQVFALFPVLKNRRRQLAGTLSGGEQQMLAIGRGMMAAPKLLLLDEPSLGLAPLIVKEIFRVIASLRDQGVTVLLVEQNAKGALAVSDRGYVLTGGRITAAGPSRSLLQNEEVKAAFLGKSARKKKNLETA